MTFDIFLFQNFHARADFDLTFVQRDDIHAEHRAAGRL
jgi:hypothetical protein